MQASNEPSGNWEFRPEGSTPSGDQPGFDTSPTDQAPQPYYDDKSVTWTASEFISHQKGAEWYAAVIGAGVVLGGVVYAITRDFISSGAILIGLILFVIISAGKPRELTYTIDNHGIKIGQKFYPYGLFKSFAIIQEGAISSINLVPLKRFMTEISIYYAPTDESKIIDVLVNSLPNDQKAERLTDRLMKRIRF